MFSYTIVNVLVCSLMFVRFKCFNCLCAVESNNIRRIVDGIDGTVHTYGRKPLIAHLSPGSARAAAAALAAVARAAAVAALFTGRVTGTRIARILGIVAGLPCGEHLFICRRAFRWPLVWALHVENRKHRNVTKVL